MQRSFEDNWNVQLSDEELKLLSEFRAADQILASLKLLVSSNSRLAKIYKQVSHKKGMSTYEVAFALEELMEDVNETNQKLQGVSALILAKQNKPIPLKLLQRLYSRIEEAILFNMKFFTTSKKKAGLILRGLAQTLEKNVVGQQFKVKKIVDTLDGFMQENYFLLQKMEHLIEQKNMMDALGAYAEDLTRTKDSVENQKKISKKARVSFAQFSPIEGIQIYQDENLQEQTVKITKNNSSSKNQSNLGLNEEDQNSIRHPTRKTLTLEQNQSKDLHQTKRSIKTGIKEKRHYFEAAMKTRKIDHMRKKSFALEALKFDYENDHHEPLLSMFSPKSSHQLFKHFSPPLQRTQLSPLFKAEKIESRRSSKTIQGKLNQHFNCTKPHSNQSDSYHKDFHFSKIGSENSHCVSSIIKPILTKDNKRKYVSADFSEQIPYFSLQARQIFSHFKKQNYKNRGSPTVKTLLIGNQYWGKLRKQGKTEQIHQQHLKKHKNHPSQIETRSSFRHQDIILQKSPVKLKSQRMKSMPQDIYIDTLGQEHYSPSHNVRFSNKKPRKSSNILKDIYNQNFKQTISGKVFNKGGIITPKQKQEEIKTAIASPVFKKSEFFAIKPKVYEIYNPKNRQLFQH